MATTTRKTLDCGHDLSPHGELDTGYATDANDQTMCYDCAAWTDVGQIVNKGRGIAYLSGDGKYLTRAFGPQSAACRSMAWAEGAAWWFRFVDSRVSPSRNGP